MRFYLLLYAALLFSCNQKSDQNPKSADTTAREDFVIHTHPPIGVDSIRKRLDAQPGGWHLMTDAETGWTAETFDYFVYPRRKADPEYPYIARGDYDCDGTPDAAVLVTDDKKNVRLVIFHNNGSVKWWNEDMQGAALTNYPKQDFGAMRDEEEVTVSLRCDAIAAEWYEKASQVIYLAGTELKNVWTGD